MVIPWLAKDCGCPPKRNRLWHKNCFPDDYVPVDGEDDIVTDYEDDGEELEEEVLEGDAVVCGGWVGWGCG